MKRKADSRFRGNDELGWLELLRFVVRKLGGDEERLAAFVERLPEPVADRLKAEWHWQAHGGQRVPDGD